MAQEAFILQAQHQVKVVECNGSIIVGLTLSSRSKKILELDSSPMKSS